MKVLLVKPPSCFTDGTPISVHNYGPPLGLLTIQKYLRNRGESADVRIMNDFSEVDSFGGYDLIGITSITATRDSCYHVANLIKKRFPKTLVFMGGPHCNGFSGPILRFYSSIDGVVEGEGEDVMYRVVAGEDWENIKGLGWRDEEGNVHFKRGHSCIDLEEVIEVDFDCVDTLSNYIDRNEDYYFHKEKRFLNITDGRGCRGTCIFCGSPRTWGTTVRQVRPEILVGMLENLHRKYDVRGFFFTNDNFVSSMRWVEAFCREVIRRKLDISWWCLGRVDLDDANALGLMRKAGCYKIKYGVESGSPHILSKLGKNINFDQVRNTVRATKNAGIETACGFMAGFPGETREDMQQTIDFANSLDLNGFSYTATMLFPGTAIFRKALDEGKITEEDFLVECRDEKSARRDKSVVCRETLPIYVPDGFEHDEFLDLCDENFSKIQSAPSHDD